MFFKDNSPLWRAYYKVVPLLFFILVVFYTIYNLFFSSSNILKLLQIKENNIYISNLLKNEEKRNEYLLSTKENIERYPNTYLEEFVREYMQMQKPNEQIILLPKNMWFEKKK